jgi:hypothetical protein
MISRLNSRKAVIHLSLIFLLSSTVLIVVTIAKGPLAASLTDHGAIQSAQAARRYRDLLRSRDQALRAMPRKTGREVSYSPELKKNVMMIRYLAPAKGEILLTAANEAAFLKPYQDALDAAGKAIADFQVAQANSNYSKE